MNMQKKLVGYLSGGAVVCLASIPPAQAWDNNLTIYALGAGITGTATLNDQTSAAAGVDFDEIVDKLEMVFMGHCERMADYTYTGL